MARRVMVAVLLGVVLLYALLILAAFVGQRALLFPAPAPAREVTGPGTLIHLPLPEGPGGRSQTVAYWLPGTRTTTLVYFHGNAEQLADAALLARLLQRTGVGVLAVEYPGYGLAGGAPSEAGLYAAGEAASLHLTQVLRIPPDQVVLLGQSLGSGVAAELALRGRGGKLVLLSPYTSIPDLAAQLLPFLPARFLVRDRLDTASKAPRITVPTLIIHGTRDEVIPCGMARALAGLFPRAALHLVEGAHHNDLWDWPQAPALAERIAAFASDP